MKTILTLFAVVLALVAVATWVHPVVSATIITGSAVGAIVAGCAKIERKEGEA